MGANLSYYGGKRENRVNETVAIITTPAVKHETVSRAHSKMASRYENCSANEEDEEQVDGQQLFGGDVVALE